jgi:16S rRNA U1498 N3-methylase RsmE
MILDLGFETVSLGENTLRVETAAVHAVAVIKNLLMESNHWKPV